MIAITGELLDDGSVASYPANQTNLVSAQDYRSLWQPFQARWWGLCVLRWILGRILPSTARQSRSAAKARRIDYRWPFTSSSKRPVKHTIHKLSVFQAWDPTAFHTRGLSSQTCESSVRWKCTWCMFLELFLRPWLTLTSSDFNSLLRDYPSKALYQSKCRYHHRTCWSRWGRRCLFWICKRHRKYHTHWKIW